MSLSLLEETRRRLDAGDPSSARRLAEGALEQARDLHRAADIGPAAKLLGECLYVIGDLDAARPLAEEALRLGEERNDGAGTAAALNLLGVLEISEGRPEMAIATLRRCYDLRAAVLGSEDGDTIESLNNLAVALWRSGSQEEAIRLHEEALRRCETALGEGHRRTAETLNALAVKVASLPDGAARARGLYERGLAAAELALGPDAELVARLLTNLAIAHIDAEDLERAGPMLDRALELHERHFGPMSRWTAHVLDAQGNLALLQGRQADARHAFERGFVIRVEELGPTHDETLDAALGLLGAMGDLAGEEDAAEVTALYMPLIALRPDLATPFFGGRADTASAGEQLRQVARRIAARHAPDANQLAARERAEALTSEADGFFLVGDSGTAQDRLREAISLLETAFGPESTLLVEPLHRLRLVLRMAGTESEVLPILERISEILATAYGAGHPLAIRALGEQYWQERREYGPAGGIHTAQRIRELTERTLGAANPVVRLVGEIMDAERASLPADARPDAERLSVRRERYLAALNPLADELLPDLASVPWPSLDHAYGPALDTSQHLRVLMADDDRLRADALELLGESILHQGSVCAATAPAMRFVRRLALDPRVPGRPALLGLLTAAHAVSGDGQDGELRKVVGDVPDLLARLAASDPDAGVAEAAGVLLGEVRRGGPWA